MSSYTPRRALDFSRSHDSADIESGKVMAVLCYLPVSPVNLIVSIVCLVQRNNAFSLYHAKQSLALLIVVLLASGTAFAVMLLAALPRESAGGLAAGFVLYAAVAITGFIFTILGIVNAATGKYKPLPLIHGLAAKMFGGIQKA